MTLLRTLCVALISAAISPVLLAQAPESGYDFEAFDSPEGWAMATTLASALNLGSGPAEHRGLFTWKIEAELASIPHLSKEQQRVGFSNQAGGGTAQAEAQGRQEGERATGWLGR
jgi:hypothetical protein